MMKSELTAAQSNSFCTTASAAKILGLSIGTIQKLVESNKLQAWKTDGGHRRISMNSIMEFKKKHSISQPIDLVSNGLPQVIIVEDDENTIKMLGAYFELWALPLNFIIYASATRALVDWHGLYPMILITDLRMPNMNGFEFIKTIRSNKTNHSMLIVAISGMSDQDIHDAGGLPEDIFVIKKPLDMEWFKGFLQGIFILKK